MLDNDQKHNQSYQWGLDMKIRPFVIHATCGCLMDKAPAVFLTRHRPIINSYFNYVYVIIRGGKDVFDSSEAP